MVLCRGVMQKAKLAIDDKFALEGGQRTWGKRLKI